MDLIEFIALGSLTFFFAFYLSYLCICLLLLKRKAITQMRAPNEFPLRVSLIIPTYNEARVIHGRFDNLENGNFPKDRLEVVFVDGGSTDGTPNILKHLAQHAGFDTRIVSQTCRTGFNNAIVEGFAATNGDIICVTGAETEYDADALNRLLAHFANPEIGAVTGRERVRSPQGLSPRLEVAYRDLYDIVREAESRIDSLFDIKGEISASRRSIMAHLVEKPELSRKGCIDCCISFQAKIDGYKAIYEPAATYWETPPKSILDSLKQQTRRAATLIQNMLMFKGMILNRKYGYFGMLIMPAHFLMLIILPLLLLIGIVGIAALIVLNPFDCLPLLISLAALFAIAISHHLQAFLKTQLALLVAAMGLIVGIETQTFERIESTRRGT